MQDLVNLHPEILGEALGLRGIEWLSPVADDDYAEYWDDDFLRRLGITLHQRPLGDLLAAERAALGCARKNPRWGCCGCGGESPRFGDGVNDPRRHPESTNHSECV